MSRRPLTKVCSRGCVYSTLIGRSLSQRSPSSCAQVQHAKHYARLCYIHEDPGGFSRFWQSSDAKGKYRKTFIDKHLRGYARTS